jgi:hypothetical protein
MNFFLIVPYYVVWHYGHAYSDIKSVWTNFLVFIYNFFAIPVLISTLFSPWMRIHDLYGPRSSIFETFMFNSMMRVFGIFVRLIFIFLGTVSLLFVVLFGIAFYIVWLLLPFILFGFWLWGFKELTK